MVDLPYHTVTASVLISFVDGSITTIQPLFIMNNFTRKVAVQSSPLLS
jgi:hypothetical protein